jgi:transcriptional regulator with XRE-family HTH domain
MAVQSRDKLIFARVQAGETQATIASELGLSRARIAQIVAEQVEILPDDQERALHAAMLDGMIAESAKIAFNSQPDPVFTVKGDVVVNPHTGEVVNDNNSHMKVKLDAMKAMDTFMNSRRKMYAHDAPKKQEMPKDEARTAIDQWLAELDEDIRIVKTVKGEVIEEADDDGHTPGTDLEA